MNETLELLDLARHDPEEYEGKIVVWRGGEYVVGSYLGTGAERIAHKLVNSLSGLCLHVLKIWRRPDLGYVPSQMRARLAAGRTPQFDFAKIIPISIEIELPGGRAEMQMYVRSPNDPTTAADTWIRKGDEMLTSLKPRQAIEAYEHALAENPNHTHALVNLAAAHADMGDAVTARKFAFQAKDIEPNYPLYHRACIQYLASDGLGRLALNEFQNAQHSFPNVCDLNDLGADLLMRCGYPEAALACAEECLLNSPEKAALVETTRAAVHAKSEARALIDKARSLVERAEPHEIVALLESAREIDRYDPLLATNLGLTLPRAERPGDAIALLLYAAMYGDPVWTKVCYANAAFCAIDQGDLQGAMALLAAAMAEFDIDIELHGRELQTLVADLPGRGIWVDDETIVEATIDSAKRIVVQSVMECQKHSTVPEGALRLAKLYAAAGSE